MKFLLLITILLTSSCATMYMNKGQIKRKACIEDIGTVEKCKYILGEE